jgi:hypothetical protein
VCKHHHTAGDLHNLNIIANLTSQAGIVYVLQKSPPTLEDGGKVFCLLWCSVKAFVLISFHMKMITNILKYLNNIFMLIWQKALFGKFSAMTFIV